MAAARVDRVIGRSVGVQRAAAKLHKMTHPAFYQIGVSPRAVHQRADLAQRYILKQNVRGAARDGDIGAERAGAVAVEHEPSGACDAVDPHAAWLIDRTAEFAGQVYGHVIRQVLIVERLYRVAQRTEVCVARTRVRGLDIQRGRPVISQRHGVGDDLIRVQLLEANVAAGAHFHEHVLVVVGIEKLEQEVLGRNGHVIGANRDTARFQLLRAHRHPRAAGVALEDIW